MTNSPGCEGTIQPISDFNRTADYLVSEITAMYGSFRNRSKAEVLGLVPSTNQLAQQYSTPAMPNETREKLLLAKFSELTAAFSLKYLIENNGKPSEIAAAMQHISLMAKEIARLRLETSMRSI